jgi:hypothetical protein
MNAPYEVSLRGGPLCGPTKQSAENQGIASGEKHRLAMT